MVAGNFETCELPSPSKSLHLPEYTEDYLGASLEWVFLCQTLVRVYVTNPRDC